MYKERKLMFNLFCCFYVNLTLYYTEHYYDNNTFLLKHKKHVDFSLFIESNYKCLMKAFD